MLSLQQQLSLLKVQFVTEQSNLVMIVPPFDFYDISIGISNKIMQNLSIVFCLYLWYHFLIIENYLQSKDTKKL
jgi:hypothetical protein